MTSKSRVFLPCLLGAAILVAGLATPAVAGVFASQGFSTPGGGGHCGHGKTINIWKQINIWKNIDINKNIDIYKPVTINKSIVINKGGVSVAISEASAASEAAATVYGGSSYAEEVVVNRGGEVGNFHAEETCQAQEATLVKAIHAVCVAAGGEEFPASHMLSQTWIDASYEGEVARCIPGAVVKAVIGEVVQSDQGMAGTYEHGQVLMCHEHEALRHYKNGMLKCTPAVPVRDCTERTNLRKYGSADFFFAYRADVCATSAREASARATDVTGMNLEGGVGE